MNIVPLIGVDPHSTTNSTIREESSSYEDKTDCLVRAGDTPRPYNGFSRQARALADYSSRRKIRLVVKVILSSTTMLATSAAATPVAAAPPAPVPVTHQIMS